jgi:hypothetical protein
MRRFLLKTISLILCAGFLPILFWVGSRPVDTSGGAGMRGYGGRLSSKAQHALEQMRRDIRDTEHLLYARTNHICLINKDAEAREYNFNYHTIWRNGYPLLPNVRAFHFEFRDGRGNLMTRPETCLSAVRTVAFTIRLEGKNGEVCSNARIRVAPTSPEDKTKSLAVMVNMDD